MRHAVVDANCNVVNVVELADGAEWTPSGRMHRSRVGVGNLRRQV